MERPEVQYVDECPLPECDVVFLGSTRADAVDHIVTSHGELLHPRWTEGERPGPDALPKLVQETRGPVRSERPAAGLDPRVASVLDRYNRLVVLAGIILILGWPILVELLFG